MAGPIVGITGDDGCQILLKYYGKLEHVDSTVCTGSSERHSARNVGS
jgi:hypothetical protein